MKKHDMLRSDLPLPMSRTDDEPYRRGTDSPMRRGREFDRYFPPQRGRGSPLRPIRKCSNNDQENVSNQWLGLNLKCSLD